MLAPNNVYIYICRYTIYHILYTISNEFKWYLPNSRNLSTLLLFWETRDTGLNLYRSHKRSNTHPREEQTINRNGLEERTLSPTIPAASWRDLKFNLFQSENESDLARRCKEKAHIPSMPYAHTPEVTTINRHCGDEAPLARATRSTRGKDIGNQRNHMLSCHVTGHHGYHDGATCATHYQSQSLNNLPCLRTCNKCIAWELGSNMKSFAAAKRTRIIRIIRITPNHTSNHTSSVWSVWITIFLPFGKLQSGSLVSPASCVHKLPSWTFRKVCLSQRPYSGPMRLSCW